MVSNNTVVHRLGNCAGMWAIRVHLQDIQNAVDRWEKGIRFCKVCQAEVLYRRHGGTIPGQPELFEEIIEDPVTFLLDMRCATCNSKMELLMKKDGLENLWLKCSCLVVVFAHERSHDLVYALTEAKT